MALICTIHKISNFIISIITESAKFTKVSLHRVCCALQCIPSDIERNDLVKSSCQGIGIISMYHGVGI